ncbi:MAG: hypothetical protein KVP17_003752 [Porospora cf. gigantea B]|uniref:uncharacterized protein n=1 Tax=Porospora cf. gigantea B TaxID=2853592 RepID=UPI003571DA7A|nr:MAG: hypothetical protein KVP17_003752 [Porospora cf. gigantea B]
MYVFQGKNFAKQTPRDADALVRHHPLVRVGLGPQEYDTKVIVRGADAPLFNEWIMFDYRRERYVTFECYDRDALESNALYNGSGSLDLMDFVQSKQRSKNFEIKLWRAKKGGKKDDVGTLLVHLELTGDASLHSGSRVWHLEDYEGGEIVAATRKTTSSKNTTSETSSNQKRPSLSLKHSTHKTSSLSRSNK